MLGEYLVDNGATVRRAARRFGISKSTVHKDVTEKLREVNPSLAAEVKRILDKNKAERHLRGGEATKEKYRR
ncbi:MAG: sporulation transcriptional regulator SpoIIID, partial [Clostridia bacterium]|nr:sporulation transcriptional regulator SpoIIID [Clostridia bacterium]